MRTPVLTGRVLACSLNEVNVAYTTFILYIMCNKMKLKTYATPPNVLFYNLCVQCFTQPLHVLALLS